jgi:L-methionine (R)-S-oxide reductase
MEQTFSIKHYDSKEETYKELLPQIQALVGSESDLVANLANVSAALKQSLKHYSWVGFYLVKDEQLVLGPFQGKVGCARIQIGKGVCGTAAERRETNVVPDVRRFAGHIACDPDSRSEIVVPILKGGRVLAVLDVDSNDPDSFDDVDKRYLERLAEMLADQFPNN